MAPVELTDVVDILFVLNVAADDAVVIELFIVVPIDEFKLFIDVPLLLFRDWLSGDFELLIRWKNFAIGFGFDFVWTTRWLRLHADDDGNKLYVSGTSNAVLFGGGFI